MRCDYLYPLSVRYRCGHTVISQEGGSRFDRQRTAAKLADQDCWECSCIKGGREVILIDGAEYVLQPILSGSDKQVAWAVRIRKRVVAKLLKSRSPGENPLEWMYFLTSSAWWIEHKNIDPEHLVTEFRNVA